MPNRFRSAAHNAPLVSVHFATLLFGLAGVLGEFVELSAIEITFGRTMFAALALTAACRLSRISVQFWKNDLHTVVLLLLSGALLAVHWSLFFTSIKLSSVAIGLVTFSTCPVFVALLEPVVYKEKLKPVAVGAAVAVLFGVILISGVYRGEVKFVAGIAFGVGGGASFAILQLVNRKLTHTSGPIQTSLVQNGVAAVILLPIVGAGLSAIKSDQWILLALLGVGCTALAHTLFIEALKKVSVTTASLIAAGLEPIYGIVLAALFLAQYPGVHVLLGSAVILITVGFVTFNQTHAEQCNDKSLW